MKIEKNTTGKTNTIKQSINKLVFIIFVLGFHSQFHAQMTKIHGKVMDSMQSPLSYANILAIPQTDDQDVKFAITEKDGSYNNNNVDIPCHVHITLIRHYYE